MALWGVEGGGRAQSGEAAPWWVFGRVGDQESRCPGWSRKGREVATSKGGGSREPEKIATSGGSRDFCLVANQGEGSATREEAVKGGLG